MRKIMVLFILLFLNINVSFAAQTIKALRIQSTAEKTRLVFDMSARPKYKIFQLQNPNRLVVDFKNAKVAKKIAQPPRKHALLKKIRTAPKKNKDYRVVFELKSKVNPSDFILGVSKKRGHRLVIDLPSKAVRVAKKMQSKKVLKTAKVTKKYKPVKVTKAVKIAPTKKSNKAVKTMAHYAKPFIVAVDAGHGGKDPGAHGKQGTLEKKVVFEIAKKLARLINKQAGMKAVMVRKGDYFIPLRERMAIARKANADLFVSIHADAFKNSKVTGASVFTLSRRGASSEAARWLAVQENAADLIGGISLNDKDDLLASILLDLSQTASQDISHLVAKDVLKNFGHIGKLHSHKVQKAGFAVLKSPDIPSILVETAFISNPKEEKRLRSPKYQLKMAQAIHKGIVSYAKKHAIALRTQTQVAGLESSTHKISRGETLLGIALQYGVTLDQLKRANTKAKNGHIRVGQVLSIPVGS
ncbi:MAG: AMIN domain-containing protein [Methyloprofundus sp.]|nr:AMIN domain-containing protein [Methyloprofundus sp.]